jgi:hypothetical protein
MKRIDRLMNKMHKLRNILIVSIVLNLCHGQQPADKGANAKTKEILDFIAGLPKQGMSIVYRTFICIILLIKKVNIFRVNSRELAEITLI